jgi:hypothetical protein
VKHDFELHPLGRIYGSLVDRDTGAPITMHSVMAVRNHLYPGHLEHDSTIAQQKGGDFGIRNLEPGDYAIQIEPVEEVNIVFPDAAASKEPVARKFYGKRWYPDAPRIETALLHLAEGESRRVQISLQSRETHTLSGTVQAPREFEREPLQLSFRPLNSRVTGTTAMRAPGPFRIENITAGSYRLSLTMGKPPNELAADYSIEITSHDLDNFKAVLTPEAGVTAKIRMQEEGASLPNLPGSLFMIPVSGWIAEVKGGGTLIGGDMPIRGGGLRQDSLRPGEYWPASSVCRKASPWRGCCLMAPT